MIKIIMTGNPTEWEWTQAESKNETKKQVIR